MGKNKSNSKRMTAKTMQKLGDEIENLLKLCSMETDREWDNFVKINECLDKIRTIELDVPKLDRPDRRSSLEPMLKWCLENGSVSHNVNVREVNDKEFGVFAETSIKEGDCVFLVPRSLMMSSETAGKSKLGPVIQFDPVLQKMPNVLVAMHILVEMAEEKSFWMPYINILPADFTSILYLNITDFEQLKGSPAFAEGLKICRSIARQYGYFYKLFRVNPVLQKLNLKKYLTYDLYRWAVSCVMSRQNAIPTRTDGDTVTSMVPLWDMCNHQHNKYSTNFNVDLDQLECKAMQDFSPGDEVTIFYGPRSNSDLFLYSGFTVANNPHDSYALRLGISKSDPLYKSKELLCLKNGLPTSGLFELKNPILFKSEEGNIISKELQMFCQILTSNKELEDEAVKIPIETLNFLATRLTLLMRSYPTTMEEDCVSLSSDLPKLQRVLIELRLSEKMLLNTVLNELNNQQSL